jgi:hypothetical protein
MDEINVDEIVEVDFSGDSQETVEVTFKDGSTRTYNGLEHPEVFKMLNHWTPPTA